MLPDELEAVRKAKMLYLSCMNESESNTFDLLTTSKKGVKKKKTANKKTPELWQPSWRRWTPSRC